MTSYKEAALKVLMSKHGLDEKASLLKIKNMDIETLDKEIDIMEKMKLGAAALCFLYELSEEESERFLLHLLYGDDIEIINFMKSKNISFTYGNIIDIINFMHEEWTYLKGDEESFQEYLANNKLYLYLPLELTGEANLLEHLIYLAPILRELGINYEEERIVMAYKERRNEFLNNHNIKNTGDLLAYLNTDFNELLEEDFQNKIRGYANDIVSLVIKVNNLG